MSKKTFIAFVSILLVRLSVGQTVDIFDTKLYSEKLTKCDFISKFIEQNRDFKYIYFDTLFFSISSYDNKSKIFGNWSFVSRNDSLDQIGFSSLDLPITLEWYNRLNRQADSLIKVFTSKYGQPNKSSTNEKYFYKNGKKYLPGEIIKAMWLVEGQKIKVEFIIDGEHSDFHYSLRISRFKDYYGNIKLPSWWDGY